jgi:COP9 signalosome complex subunit 3
MDPLEALVAQIQGLSSSSADIARLHTILKQSDDSLRSNSSRLFPILSLIDPSIHSLGFLYVLYAILTFPSQNQIIFC